MNTPRFDGLTRRAADTVSGHRSLLLAMGAGAATASFGPSSARAGKNARKANTRKKRTCNRQIDQCQSFYVDFCATQDVDCNDEERAYLMSCCALLANCKAGAAMDCLFGFIF